MKKSILIIIALISISMSCKVDQSGVPKLTNNTTLNGTWILRSEIINGFSGSTAAKPDTITHFPQKNYYTFNSDNTVIYLSPASTAVNTNYYSVLTIAGSQTLTLGTSAGGAGLAYTVNKLSADSLILYNTAIATTSGVTATTYTTTFYTH